MTERRRNDVTFMQVESLRVYKEKTQTSFKEASSMFEKHNIFQFILDNYDYLQLMGIYYVVEEIEDVFKKGGWSRSEFV